MKQSSASSDSLPVNPPTTSTPPDRGVNVPAPDAPPIPRQRGILEQPGSLPVNGDPIQGAVRRTPAPSRVAPLRGTPPVRLPRG
jgi:hypothetical protein